MLVGTLLQMQMWWSNTYVTDWQLVKPWCGFRTQVASLCCLEEKCLLNTSQHCFTYFTLLQNNDKHSASSISIQILKQYCYKKHINSRNRIGLNDGTWNFLTLVNISSNKMGNYIISMVTQYCCIAQHEYHVWGTPLLPASWPVWPFKGIDMVSGEDWALQGILDRSHHQNVKLNRGDLKSYWKLVWIWWQAVRKSL